MKVTKTFTIDVEVAVELSKLKRSASTIINSYLRDYFELNNTKTPEQNLPKEIEEVFDDKDKE